MSIKDITMKSGATYTAPTTGTNVDFDPTAIPPDMKNTVGVANFGNTVFRERENILFYSRLPGLSNGVYGKTLRKATIFMPRDYDTLYVKNRLAIEADLHPSMSSADKALICDLGAQLLLFAARDFFLEGSME